MQSKLVIGSVCAFSLGVGLRSVYELLPPGTLCFLLLALAIGLVWRQKGSAISAPPLLFLSLLLLFLSLGIIRTEIASWQFNVSSLEQSLDQPVTFIGIVRAEPDYRERTVNLYIETKDDLILVTTDRLNSFFYGDKVTVTGKLERPEVFTTELGRTFNYPGYLRARGVEYRISFAEVNVLDSGQGNPFISGLLYAKQNFIKSLQSVIPEPAVGLGNGLLLGVKSALGEDIEQDFRRTGIIHIVVLSGYNVMLVVAFIMFCFSFLLPFQLRIVAGIIAIVCFALIVGLSATVIRASVMAVLVLLAQVLGRRYNVLRALLLAGAVMLIINPYLLIYDIGFQLSFMATLGLILIVPQFESTVMTTESRLGWREFFLATLSTQIAVLPLLMYHIGQVSLIAIVVNVLVLPVVPLAMLLTFLAGLVGFVSVSLASLIGYVATLSLTYILLVAEYFADIPFAAVTVPQFSAMGVFLMYAAMIAFWYFIKTRRQNPDQLSGWTIEEETEPPDGFLKLNPDGSPIISPDTPIFFR
jgi:competence protein ComEC